MVDVRKRCLAGLALCVQFVLGIDLPCSAWAGMPTNGSSDGLGTNAMFESIRVIRISPDGTFALVADSHSLRSIDISTRSVTLVNFPLGIPFNLRDLSISPDASFALITDSTNQLIHQIMISTRQVTIFAGQASNVDSTSWNGIGTNAGFVALSGISIAPSGLFALATQWGMIRRLVISTAEVSILAGHKRTPKEKVFDDIGSNARFRGPARVAISPDSSYALVIDPVEATIRRIDISTATVTTLAGESERRGAANGIRTAAHFSHLHAISISPDGSYALVVDAIRIRYIVISTGEVRTLPTSENISSTGFSISPDGSYALAVDESGHQILYIDLTSLTRSEAPERAVVGLAQPSESSLTCDSSQPMAIPDLEMLFQSSLFKEAMRLMPLFPFLILVPGVVLLALLWRQNVILQVG
jgi:DNA-binding beta-propeller fold protein YncE